MKRSTKIFLAYLAFFAVMWLIAEASGANDISEICAVEGVGCPTYDWQTGELVYPDGTRVKK